MISVEVGHAGWCRGWKCDRNGCDAQVVRKLTGTRGLATQWNSESQLEYDEERFESEETLNGWISITPVAPHDATWHLCPKCAPPFFDNVLDLCRPAQVIREQARNVVERAWSDTL